VRPRQVLNKAPKLIGDRTGEPGDLRIVGANRCDDSNSGNSRAIELCLDELRHVFVLTSGDRFFTAR